MNKIFLLVLTSFLSIAAELYTRETDSLALVAIRDANPGSSIATTMGGSTSWEEGNPIDNWKGVNIYYIDGRVKNLTLPADVYVFPNNLAGFTDITSVHLTCDNYTALPTGLWNLNKLWEIKLYNYPLKTLSDTLTKIRGLGSLTVEGDSLEELPEDIGVYGDFMYLKIDNCPLKKLPESIVNLRFDNEYSILEFNRTQLNPETLSDTIKIWLDTYEPYWKSKQIVNVIESMGFSTLPSIQIASGVLTFSKAINQGNINVVNVHGQKVFENSFFGDRVELPELASGFYFATVYCNGKNLSLALRL